MGLTPSRYYGQVDLPVNVTRELNHGGKILVSGTISIAEHDVKSEQKRIIKIKRRRTER